MSTSQSSTDPIAFCLLGILTDGFNRSLRALVEAGALDDTILRKHYQGAGSRYYDLVTEQMEITAKHGAEAIRNLSAV